jgi:cytochrome oxidase Cu insertion factor (SCO1/SenC/PrrC family)
MTTADDPAAPPDRRRRHRLLAVLLVLATLAAAAAVAAWNARLGPETWRSLLPGSRPALLGFALDPPRPAPDLRMTAHTGRPFQLADLRGQAVLVFFGYTYCPDICPTTLAKVSAALRQLGDDADHVTMLFVTLDPDRDSLSGLARYLGNFHPRILGLRADKATIAAAAKAYGVSYGVDAPAGATPDPKNYTISHSGYVFLIDPAGQLRDAFVGDFLPEDMAHDTRVVLNEAR